MKVITEKPEVPMWVEMRQQCNRCGVVFELEAGDAVIESDDSIRFQCNCGNWFTVHTNDVLEGYNDRMKFKRTIGVNKKYLELMTKRWDKIEFKPIPQKRSIWQKLFS